MDKEIRILHLTLKKKWFDMILSGEKKEEYREHKLYWKTRLVKDGHWFSQACKEYDVIVFKNGYAKDARVMTVECKGIVVKDSHLANKAWCEDVGLSGRLFVISLGNIISHSPKRSKK